MKYDDKYEDVWPGDEPEPGIVFRHNYWGPCCVSCGTGTYWVVNGLPTCSEECAYRIWNEHEEEEEE